MKVVYIANDGKQFETKEECLDYEDDLKDKEIAKEVLEKIKAICEKNVCLYCPFRGNSTNCVFGSTEMPEDFLKEVRWD